DGHFALSGANIDRGSGSGQSNASIWLSLMRLAPHRRAVALALLAACSRAPGPVLAPPPVAAPVPPAAAPGGASARPAPAAVPVTARTLPPIPTVDGPLKLRVAY